MSNVLNNFALGRGVGSLVITPQTPNSSTGVLTAGTSKSILGQFKTWKISQTNTTEEISPSSARARNLMILDSGVKLDMSGILFASDSTGSSTNPINPMVQSNDYVSVQCTRGALSVTVLGIVLEYSEEIKDKGSINFTLSLGEIDINTNNPQFA